MILQSDPINHGSFAVRIWIDGGFGDPYDTVCVINKITDDVCEISPCLGKLSDEINVELCHECFHLGFKTMLFSVISGSRVTRRAEYIDTIGKFDHYKVNLLEVVNG